MKPETFVSTSSSSFDGLWKKSEIRRSMCDESESAVFASSGAGWVPRFDRKAEKRVRGMKLLRRSLEPLIHEDNA